MSREEQIKRMKRKLSNMKAEKVYDLWGKVSEYLVDAGFGNKGRFEIVIRDKYEPAPYGQEIEPINYKEG